MKHQTNGELRRLLQIRRLGRTHHYSLRDSQLERLLRDISDWMRV